MNIEVDLNMPTIRDSDNQLYIRQWSGGILSGCFELNGKPCFKEGVPDSFQFQLLPEDWDHCRKLCLRSPHQLCWMCVQWLCIAKLYMGTMYRNNCSVLLMFFF